MVKARKYVVKSRIQGTPKRSDYEIVEYELPSLQNGEFVVKTEWVSVDPYLRAYNYRHQLPYDQFSYQVGVVQETKDPNFPVGSRVVSHKGWADYVILSAKHAGSGLDQMYKLPDLKGLSESHGIGAVGMPGVSAYFGLLEICKPKAGETLVVTGAAGAVGSLVGQIGKIKGCTVIGFAGSDDKVKWLEEIGFDKAFNYKTVDAAAALKQAAPNGVDCYFDNVGGELSSIIMSQMNEFGRVSICGSITSYDADQSKLPKVTLLQPAILYKQLKVEGFLIARWFDQWPAAFEVIVGWIKSGKLQPKEHITKGFDNLFDAFVGMLNGENFGKAVVKL